MIEDEKLEEFTLRKRQEKTKMELFQEIREPQQKMQKIRDGSAELVVSGKTNVEDLLNMEQEKV